MPKIPTIEDELIEEVVEEKQTKKLSPAEMQRKQFMASLHAIKPVEKKPTPKPLSAQFLNSEEKK